MKVKKIISLVLTGSALIFLAGCGTKEKTSYNSSEIVSSQIDNSSNKTSTSSESKSLSERSTSSVASTSSVQRSTSSVASTSSVQRSTSSVASTSSVQRSTSSAASTSSVQSSTTMASSSESSKTNVEIVLPSDNDTCDVVIDFNYSGSFNFNATFKVGQRYELPQPTRDGYKFMGWYNGDTLIDLIGIWNLTGNVTIKAEWVKIYAINLDVNGGNALANNNISIIAGEEYELPTPTREHYSFAGWYNDDEIVEMNGNYSFEDDLDLTAKWNYVSKITLDVNGGNELNNSVIYIKLNDILVLPTPVRNCYKFIGWYNGDILINSNTSWDVTEDTVLEAKWAEAYNVEFNLNYDGAKAINSMSIAYNEAYKLPTPEREGYTFKGWYNDGVSVLLESKWYIKSSVILDAEWEINTYTLQLDPDGGSGVESTAQLLEYDSVIELPTLYKTNYVFDGWYDGNLKIDSTTIRITGNTLLRAHWTYSDKRFLIIYEVDNSVSIDSKYQNVNYGDYYTLETPTKSGYEFDCWYDANGKYYINGGTYDLLEDLVLYPMFYDKGLKFTLNSNTNTYSVKYEGTAKNVVVPYMYHGLSVTKIGYVAFANNNYVETVELPYSITTIEGSAFYGCKNLKSVNIPSSVSRIESYAFFNCESITNISLPQNINAIYNYTFAHCKSLQYLILPKNLLEFAINTAVEDCPKLNGLYYQGGLYLGVGSYDYAVLFAVINNEIEELTIHPDCKWIKDGICAGLTNLKTVKFYSNFANIPYKAFYNCTSLETVFLHTGSEYAIGEDAFDGCTKLATVTFDTNNCTSIGSGAFMDCKSLKSIIIPYSVSFIGMWAFDGSALTSVTFNDTVNWYTSLSTDGSVFETLASKNLSSKKKAATYLKDTYVGRYWFKETVED